MKCLQILMKVSDVRELERGIFRVPGVGGMHSRALPGDFSASQACALGRAVAAQLRACGGRCFRRFYASLWPPRGRHFCVSRHNGIFQELQTVSGDGIISLGNRRGDIKLDHWNLHSCSRQEHSKLQFLS